MKRAVPPLLLSLIQAPWYRWVLALAIYLEFYLILAGRNPLGYFGSPLALLLLGVFIGLFPILLSQTRKRIPREPIPLLWPNQRPLLIFGLFALGAIACTFMVADVYSAHPVSLEASGDIIPSVKLFAQRLLGRADGLPVYAEYYGFGYKLSPTYLPLQWMPFVIPELLGIDYRWAPYGIFLIGLFFYFLWLNRRNWSLVWTVLAAIAPFLFLHEMAQPHKGYVTWTILANSIELMDVGYYMILAYALLQGSVAMRGVGFLLTLLSRFSHLFWVPFFFAGAFFKESKRQTILTALIVFAGILLLYVVPFLSQDWKSFSRGQEHYTRAALGAWDIGKEADYPYALKHGLGMAIYLYDGSEAPLLEKVNTARSLHLIVSIGAALLVGLGFIFGQKRLEARYYFLFGLKFYFAFFYAFIQVPYPYLFILPLFLSLYVLLAVGEGVKR